MLRIIVGVGAIQVVAVLAGVLRAKIAAVVLGPQGVGAIGLVDQLVQLVLYLSTFSLPFAAMRTLSRAHSDGQPIFRQAFASLLRILLVLTGFGAALSIGIVLVDPSLLGAQLTDYRLLLLPALVGVPAMGCLGFFSSVLAAARRPRAAAVSALIVAVTITTSSLSGLSLGGLFGWYWANLVGNLGLTVGLLIYLQRALGLSIFLADLDVRQQVRQNLDLVLLTLALYASSLASSFALFVARYAVLASSGQLELGLLQAGIALFAAMNTVLGQANVLWLAPTLNRRGAPQDKIRTTEEFQRKILLVILAVAVPSILFLHIVVLVLFSPEFLPGVLSIGLVILAQCIMLMAGNYHTLMIGLGDLKAYGLISVVGHGSLAAFAWLLAPSFGLVGVGAGFVLGTLIHFLLAYARLSTRWGLYVERRRWFAMAYGLAALGLSVASLTLDPRSPAVIGTKFTAYAMFVVSLLAQLDRDEVRQLIVQGQRVVFLGAPSQAARPGGTS